MNCTIYEIKSWFHAEGHSKVIVGQKCYFLDKIFDIDIMKLLYDLYNNQLVYPSLFFQNATGTHIPKSKSILKTACENNRSKLYEKVSDFEIDTSDMIVPIIYDNISGLHEKIDDREISGCPNLDFININLSKCSITKFDQLARIYNTTAIFLSNELHLKICDIDKPCTHKPLR